MYVWVEVTAACERMQKVGGVREEEGGERAESFQALQHQERPDQSLHVNCEVHTQTCTQFSNRQVNWQIFAGSKLNRR
jgi:hypothetical protein